MSIILINGLKRSGKDTFADILVKKGYKKLSFAYEIKKIISNILKISIEEFDELKNTNTLLDIKYDSFLINYRIALQEMAKNYNVEKEKIEEFDIINISLIKIDNTLKLNCRRFIQSFDSWKHLFNDQNIWENILYSKITKTDNIVISDFRFPQEFKENFKVTTVKIIGKNYHDNSDDHISENGLSNFKFDYYINNTIWDDILISYQAELLIKTIG